MSNKYINGQWKELYIRRTRIILKMPKSKTFANHTISPSVKWYVRKMAWSTTKIDNGIK